MEVNNRSLSPIPEVHIEIRELDPLPTRVGQTATRCLDPLTKGCGVIKQVNKNLPIILKGATEQLEKGWLDPVSTVTHPIHEVVDKLRELTVDTLDWSPIRYTVYAAKMITLYSAYKDLKKGLSNSQIGNRARALSDHARGIHSMARAHWQFLKGSKTALSGFRAAQAILQFQPLGTAYKTYLFPAVDLSATVTTWLHINAAEEILSEVELEDPKQALDWLKEQLSLSAEEKKRIKEVAADMSDVEAGRIVAPQQLTQQVLKDKENNLIALIGKPATRLLMDVIKADKAGERRIPDRTVIHYFHKAVEEHLHTQRKSRMATGSSFASVALSCAVPGSSFMIFALKALSIGLVADLTYEGLTKKTPTYDITNVVEEV